jgi:hypothetical protein
MVPILPVLMLAPGKGKRVTASVTWPLSENCANVKKGTKKYTPSKRNFFILLKGF